MGIHPGLYHFLVVLTHHRRSTIHNARTHCCTVHSFYNNIVIFIANVNVDHLKSLGTAITAEDCLSLCCNLGQKQCQYLWVFKEACFSVGCDNGNIGCLPQLLPIGVKVDSIYVEMQYVAMETDLDGVEELLDSQLVDKDRNKNNKDGINEKEHPLVADAGGDVTVRLPVDMMHLYGNASKSDHVSLRFSSA